MEKIFLFIGLKNSVRFMLCRRRRIAYDHKEQPMTLFSKTSVVVVAGLAAYALSLPANALLVTYDDLVTGATPTSGTPWLTANITDLSGNSGVSMKLDVGVDAPEFLTSVFFSLGKSATLSGVTDPATTPDIDLANCSGKAPANTGPWQLCLAFSPNLQVSSPASITLSLLGLHVSDFVTNASGWLSVAHIQGVQPNCSAWVGDYRGGSVAPSADSTCTTSAPEPTTLSLLGAGLVGLFGARLRRRRQAVTA